MTCENREKHAPHRDAYGLCAGVQKEGFRLPVRVNGIAAIGDIVTYEDRANPRATYRVKAFRAGLGGEYGLLCVDTGETIWSDLRQYGWTRA